MLPIPVAHAVTPTRIRPVSMEVPASRMEKIVEGWMLDVDNRDLAELLLPARTHITWATTAVDTTVLAKYAGLAESAVMIAPNLTLYQTKLVSALMACHKRKPCLESARLQNSAEDIAGLIRMVLSKFRDLGQFSGRLDAFTKKASSGNPHQNSRTKSIF